MNKLYTLLLFCFLGINGLQAQEEATPPVDTTIYVVADKAPRFPGCEKLDTTETVIYDCAQKSLLRFIYDNVGYPLEARRQNLEGTVVASFVVEKDGTISYPSIVKDIGGGCGQEVMRVVGAMNEVGIRWRAGLKAGKSVRTRFNLPVKFRLEEAPDFIMVGRDSVFTNLEKQVTYTAGDEELVTFIKQNTQVPAGWQDSCYVGYMDISLLVRPNGSVKVMNVNDYNKLGFDFQFEAIQMANATYGKWTPAICKGRAVPALIDFRVPFESDAPNCTAFLDDFTKAETLAAEGSELFNKGEKEPGLEKLSAAIELFPNNADFRYLRGQAYLADKNFELACEDFKVVREVLTNSPVEDVYPILCR